MSQSLAKLTTHIVFSTKGRYPYLLDEHRELIHAKIKDSIILSNSHPIEIGSVEDHIHLLIGVSKNISVSGLVEKIKVASSRWIKLNNVGAESFSWQSGYGAFGVSESNLEVVRRYIQNQREHHRLFSYENEMETLLKKHHVEFDKKYLFT